MLRKKQENIQRWSEELLFDLTDQSVSQSEFDGCPQNELQETKVAQKKQTFGPFSCWRELE